MPSVVLTLADLLSWDVDVLSSSSPGGTLTFSGDLDVGELDIVGLGSSTQSSPTGGSNAGPVQLNWHVIASGLLDLSAIPALAMIDSVEITCNAEIEADGSAEGDVAATFAGAGSCTATAYCNLDMYLETTICGINLPDIEVQDNAQDVDTGPNSASALQPNAGSDTLTYSDTTLIGIPKEAFESSAGVSLETGATTMAAQGGASSTQPRLTCVSSAAADIHAELHFLTDWEITINFTPQVSELEVTQSGEMALSGGGLVQTNNITQSGQLYLDGGGSDFYIIAPEISGIYVLVPNKRDDTWYDKTVNPAVTIDVKIPDPFVSFAFLPEDE